MWKDQGDYYLLTAGQGSQKWKNIRKEKLALTCSNFSIAAGNSTRFKTAEQLARFHIGLDKEEYSKESIRHMSRGNKLEPDVRKWYEKYMKCTVDEVGLAVPKWDRRIGGSVDGLVGKDGIIEIKVPENIYLPLVEKSKEDNKQDHQKQELHESDPHEQGHCKENRYNHNHIYNSHYDQIQGYLAILQREWCDYIVYGSQDDEIYVERVYRNREYWEDDLYPKIKKYFDTVLLPLLQKQGVMSVPEITIE